VRKEKTLSVTIPRGVEDGQRIRLSGEGEAGLNGASAGDLYIFIGVKPHAIFQRDGADIHCRVPLPMATAALGGTVEVPTIEGTRAHVTIPAGTQSGHQFRLRAKGMTGLHGRGRGDMYIDIMVETPVNLSKKQQDLLREFEKSGGTGARSTSPQSEGFFTKVKELWQDLTE
jgi:molecular chaperone DnaJ